MRLFSKVGLLALVAGLGSSVAQAAVPVAAEGVFTTAATDFGTILGWGYTLMIAVVGGMIVLGLVKKVAGKAT